MTRLEEIVQKAKHHEREEGFTEIINYTKGIYSVYGIGFLEGAEWADKTMLDKVCRFIKELCRVCDITDENGYVVDYNRIEVELRKQMKGE